MTDTRTEFLGCLYGVLLGEGEVASIKAEVNVARIGVVHQALGFLEGLNDRRHMVMEAQLEAAVSSDLAELVQAVAQLVPLFIGGNRLVAAEHRALLCEQATGQLAYVDAACTDSLEEVQLLDKCLFVLLVGGRAQEAREPLGCNLDAAQVECLVQYGRVGRELAANLGA